MIIKTFVEGPICANNYLLIDEKSNDAILIDCSDAREEFIAQVKELGLNLRYILLTHGHFDHILGIETFCKVFNTSFYLAKEDEIQLKNSIDMARKFAGLNIDGIKIKPKFVHDGDEFCVGNIKLKALSTPGHTQGGMCYLTDDGKLFSGDTLFQGSVGRCDLDGGDWDKLLNSVKEKLFKLPQTTEVFPGHGPKTTIGNEIKYNEIIGY